MNANIKNIYKVFIVFILINFIFPKINKVEFLGIEFEGVLKDDINILLSIILLFIFINIIYIKILNSEKILKNIINKKTENLFHKKEELGRDKYNSEMNQLTAITEKWVMNHRISKAVELIVNKVVPAILTLFILIFLACELI